MQHEAVDPYGEDMPHAVQHLFCQCKQLVTREVQIQPLFRFFLFRLRLRGRRSLFLGLLFFVPVFQLFKQRTVRIDLDKLAADLRRGFEVSADILGVYPDPHQRYKQDEQDDQPYHGQHRYAEYLQYHA